MLWNGGPADRNHIRTKCSPVNAGSKPVQLLPKLTLCHSRISDRLGIPIYDELVLVANSDRLGDEAQNIRLFLAALQRGTRAAVDDPAGATKAILDAGKGLDPKVTAAEVRKTLPLLFPTNTGHAYGYMDPKQWDAFAHFFADHGLIKALPSPGDVLTNDYLPGKIP